MQLRNRRISNIDIMAALLFLLLTPYFAESKAGKSMYSLVPHNCLPTRLSMFFTKKLSNFHKQSAISCQIFHFIQTLLSQLLALGENTDAIGIKSLAV